MSTILRRAISISCELLSRLQVACTLQIPNHQHPILTALRCCFRAGQRLLRWPITQLRGTATIRPHWTRTCPVNLLPSLLANCPKIMMIARSALSLTASPFGARSSSATQQCCRPRRDWSGFALPSWRKNRQCKPRPYFRVDALFSCFVVGCAFSPCQGMYDENGHPIKGRTLTHEPPAYATSAVRQQPVMMPEAPRYTSHIIASREEWGIDMVEACCTRWYLSWLVSHACCFPCQAARICDAVGNDKDYSCNPGMGCVLCAIFPCSPVVAMCLRGRTIHKYNLIHTESPVGTCLRGILCPFCSQCQIQMHLEMNSRFPGTVFCSAPPSSVRPPPSQPPMDRSRSVHSPFNPNAQRDDVNPNSSAVGGPSRRESA